MNALDIEGQRLTLASSSAPASYQPPRSSLTARLPQWKPSKKAIWIGAAGVAVAAILSFGLVFGLGGSSSSSSPSSPASVDNELVTTDLPSSCQDMTAAKFWEYLTPTHYHLNVKLQEEHFAYSDAAPMGTLPTFNGSVTIEFNVTRATSCVLLNALNLTFSHVTAQREGEEEPAVLCSDISGCASALQPVDFSAPSSSAYTDLVAVDLGDVQLEAGTTASLTFNYSGLVSPTPDVLGIHRSAPFVSCAANNERSGGVQGGNEPCQARVLIATQLERTGARRVFPCYDMPASKAIFHVAVQVPAGSAPVVLSNARQLSRVAPEDGSSYLIQFEPTPVMSPYLVAIAAGDLQQTLTTAPAAGRRLAASPSNLTSSNYEVFGWAAPGRGAEMATAVQMARQALVYYEGYFAKEQPLTRFDLVAIPGKTGAMENWGLVLLDEPRVLFNASTGSSYDLSRVASIVCHELAHQWVGNLVTCPDWTELLMNEGLATALEYDCMGVVAPGLPAAALRYRTIAPSGEKPSAHDGPLVTALIVAGDPLTPPAIPVSEFDLDSPAATRNVYAKGGSFFLMLRTYLDLALGALRPFAPVSAFPGAPPSSGVFQDVMRRVIASRAYSTLSTYDFMKAVNEAVAASAAAAAAADPAGFAVFPAASGFLIRAAPYLAATTPEEQRAVGTNGTATLASWFYTPTFPRMNAQKPDMIVPSNYSVSLLTFGQNQTRFCAWNVSLEEAAAAGVEQEQVDAIKFACYNPVRFSTSLSLDNLTDCAAAGQTYDISTVNGPAGYGNLSAERWVANQDGSRLWRTSYGPPHFDNLVTEMAGMTACPKPWDPSSDDPDTAVCCADDSDMTEAAAVMADAVAFAFTGAYPGSWAIRAVEAAGLSPAATSAAGQYLLLLPAVEALASLRPLVQGNATCVQLLDELRVELLAPDRTAAILKGVTGSAGGADVLSADSAALGEAQHEVMQHMAASQLLRQAALMPGINVTFPVGSAASPAKEPAPEGRRRRALLQSSAPLPAAEDTEPDGADIVAAAPEEDPEPDGEDITAGQVPAEAPAGGGAAPPEVAPAPADEEQGGGDYGEAPAAAPGPQPEEQPDAEAAGPAVAAAPDPDPAAPKPAAPAPMSPAAVPKAAPTPAPASPELAPPAAATPFGGDGALQAQLCQLLPSTPVWRNYLESTQVTGAGGGAPEGSPSPDLLPAIYAAAGAMPPGCSATIAEEFATTASAKASTEEMNVVVLSAFVRCWLFDPSYVEAQRCLYAAPAAAGYTDFTTVLVLFGKYRNVTVDSEQYLLRRAERNALLFQLRGWIYSLASTQSPEGMADTLAVLNSDSVFNLLGARTACEILDYLRPATTPDEVDKLNTFLGGYGKQCSPVTRARAFGRKVQRQAVLADAAADMCAYLDARQGAKR